MISSLSNANRPSTVRPQKNHPLKSRIRFGESAPPATTPVLSPISADVSTITPSSLQPQPVSLPSPVAGISKPFTQPGKVTTDKATSSAKPINPILKSMAGQQILYPVAPVLDYIKAQWTNLLVTNRQLLDVMKDPKVNQPPGTPWRLYISEQENPQRVWADLQQSLPPESLKQIQLAKLPPPGQRNNLPPGLLYLPHPYVVPGGRFKEMYGWDSYFIQLGLLKDGHLKTAKDMTDNMLYEINNYGTILNANRSYFINRSQPPFITQMVLNVYNKTGDKAWLQQAMPAIEKHYAYWNSGGHLIKNGPAAGLSRYFAYGEGPALEVLQGEVENGKNHYDKIKDYYRTHKITDYDVKDYYDAKTDQLTPLFYKADRTMRESGFDPSNRFGPFNIDITNYAPVCLNSLLFKMEKDMGQIYQTLGKPAQAATMEQLANQRKQRMNNVLWDAKTGTYLDYNIKTNQRRFYPYATMFFPMWAGAASPQQAKQLMQKLPFMEAPGGLMTSVVRSGNQWDAPFAWAPLQYTAVKGLQNYSNIPGAKEAALRLSNKYVNQVAKEFSEEGGIFEKYDASRMESDVADGIDYGYDSNELGFGWSNGVFLELLDVAKPGLRQAVKPQAPMSQTSAVQTVNPQNPNTQASANPLQQNPFRFNGRVPISA
jgi:alpha,alpha-trehalase